MAEVKLSAAQLKALSSDVRIKIIKALKERRYTLSELSQKFNMSAPTIKQHLDILVENEFVKQIDEGRKWKYYSLTNKGQEVAFSEERKTVFMLILSTAVIFVIATFYMVSTHLNAAISSSGTEGVQSKISQSVLGVSSQEVNTTEKNLNTNVKGLTAAMQFLPILIYVIIAAAFAFLSIYYLTKFHKK